MATTNETVDKVLADLSRRAGEYSSTHFRRPSLFTATKTAVTIPSGMEVVINGKMYLTTSTTTLQASSVATQASRAGKDYYIYACVPSSGTAPTFVLSANSTVPSGYTASNSRKIGGFHCLCVSAGSGMTTKNPTTGATINHPLNYYIAGDILPASRWDLWHRPKGLTEGMVYLGDNNCDVWLSIYLLSWDGTNLVSKYNGVTADGTSTKKWHGELFAETLNMQNMRLPWRFEFVWGARGSNEATNIAGSADANTTGGHKDTANRRMISHIGCEDCCGFLWQWLFETMCWGDGWGDSVYNSTVDPQSYGRTYGSFRRPLAGGYWNDGSGCGSRSASGDSASSYVYADRGGRGASEPLHAQALTDTGYYA